MFARHSIQFKAHAVLTLTLYPAFDLMACLIVAIVAIVAI